MLCVATQGWIGPRLCPEGSLVVSYLDTALRDEDGVPRQISIYIYFDYYVSETVEKPTKHLSYFCPKILNGPYLTLSKTERDVAQWQECSPISSKGFFYMHHPTDRITHTTAFVTPVVEHWLEREIAQWIHPIEDGSNDPSHHQQTLLPQSYISLPIL